MLARQVNAHIAAGSPFFSLEFFPPQTVKGVNGCVTDGTRAEIHKFAKTLSHLKEANPLFVDVTWFVRNNPGNLAVPNSSSSTAVLVREECGVENVMLHVTCNGFPAGRTQFYLRQALANGVKNFLALRGDDLKEKPVMTDDPTDFWAADLVRWCRSLPVSESERREVTVAVAGDPRCHPLCSDYSQHLRYLRAKVEAGADFIVTQFFLEVAIFERFVRDCREAGIQVPILPGILLFKVLPRATPYWGTMHATMLVFQNAGSLQRIAKISDVTIPEHVSCVLDANKKNTKTVQNYAKWLAFNMCHELLVRRSAPGIHLFTMNQEEGSGLLLRRLGLWQRVDSYEHRCLAGPIVNRSVHVRHVWTLVVERLIMTKKAVIEAPKSLPALKPERAVKLELPATMIIPRVPVVLVEKKASLLKDFWLDWLQEQPAVKHSGKIQLYSAFSPHISHPTSIINAPLHTR